MLIEVLDKNAKPIGALDEKDVHSQELFHKRVLLLAYDKEKRICLVRYNNSNAWDFVVNEHVPAFKSIEEVVVDSFKKRFGTFISPKLLIKSYLDSKTKEFITVFYTTNLTQLILIDYSIIEDIAFVTRKDFNSAVTGFPQFCNYYLKLCYKLGITFYGIGK